MILFWRDYHVVTVSDDCRAAWRWEIRRRSAPMGVKLNGDGYLSQRAAEEAGKQALATFLTALTSEGGADDTAVVRSWIALPDVYADRE